VTSKATRFDTSETFDEDYLYFYEALLTPERNQRDADTIARALELPAGAAILDAPCGHGRIANLLAARGYNVTGLDVTPLFLDAARRDATDESLAVEYVHGDIRDLQWRERFDGIVNWFTSFGYFDDDTNRAVLRGFRAALRPGGRLLVEQLNRDRVVQNLPSAGASQERVLLIAERGDDLLFDRVRFDEQANRTVTERIVVRNGRVRRFVFTVRTFTVPEITSWLLDAGFSSVDVLDSTLEPFSLAAERMIVVAHA
jgi:SAM-dependent methyltransferase